MAKHVAPVSLTGGDGFNYEDRVAARFLVDLLAGISPFGADFGCVTRVDWQVRDTGRLLDDLAITLDSGTAVHVAECSIKSHRQVTSNGFPRGFVEAAWEEWLHTESTAFQNDRDLLVLITGEIANAVQEDWSTLLREARATTSHRFIRRLQPPAAGAGSQTSEIVRELFQSLQCPDSLRSRGQSDQAAAVEMIRRIRLLHFDFESDPSRDEARAVADCRRLVNLGDLAEGQRLWGSLVALAAECRGSGGALDLPTLLSRLRSSFELIGHPDFRSDWAALQRATNDVLSGVRAEVGAGQRIERDQEIRELTNALDAAQLCLAAGESGCGKSALAKQLASTTYDTVVALLPEDFEHERLQRLEASLGLAHPLLEILGASRERCLLLLESMERFSERGLRLAGNLIGGLLADTRYSHVHILLLMQYDAATRVITRLAEAGIAQEKLEIAPIDYPPEPAIRNVLMNVQGVPWATLHIELRPLLRNLKILDWVVRAAQSGHGQLGSQVTGLIALIDYLWSRWIESDDRGIAGGGLLKRLATLEASSLASGVALTSLEYAEQQSLAALSSVDLLRRRNERVHFSHDLLGDWARLKVLIGEDPTRSSADLQRCGMARWHRAVRLFGRWLLTQNDGVRRWSEAVARAENGTDEGTVIRDLLLESIVVSEASRRLLALAWPVLVEGDGRLLKLLLDRFIFIATIPDLRLPRLVKSKSIAPQVEVVFRVPLWPYWGSFLATLDEHRDEVCRLAPGEAARICKMYLEKTPVEVAPGTAFPGRAHAASVALRVARECQARRAEKQSPRVRDEHPAYEAALLSAHEAPDQVAAFALEMARRRPPSAEVQSRADAARIAADLARRRWQEENPEQVRELRELGESPFPLGPLREPWPDGPTGHVESAFRKAVLDSQALLTLAEVRPDAALEVLLAVCIEPPHHEDPYGSELMDDCGLESWHSHQPAMYFEGPFLQLIRLCPTHGIEFALRLVNFATSRWMDQEERRRQRRGNVSAELAGFIEVDDSLDVLLQFDDQDKPWRGDRRVFRWYLDWPIDCRIIPCVLMALEKWLYEQIDADSDVEPWLQLIVTRSESVAFAGLLIDVGKRAPQLFATSLRPLLSSSVFYLWEPRILMERSSIPLGLMGWWNQPQDLVELAREWHSAPHRKHELRRIAVWLMHNSADMETFFRTCRERWQPELEANPAASDLRMLMEMLDRQNYRETPLGDGRVQIEFVPSEVLSQQARQDCQRADDSLRLLSFPMDCRRILDGEKELLVQDCPSFWDTANRIADQSMNDDDEHAHRAAAISGAVAVLLVVHSDWVAADPERAKWCFDQLHNVIENPPPRRQFDVPDSVGDRKWDCFVAEAGVCLLKSEPDDWFVRDLIAHGVAGYHYGTTQKVMKLAHRLRQSLGGTFESMQQLAIQWSLVRRVRSRVGCYLSEVDRWRQAGSLSPDMAETCRLLEAESAKWRDEHSRIVDAFVSSGTEPMTLQDASRLGQEAVERLIGIRYPARRSGKRPSRRGRSYHRRRRVRRKDLGLDDKVIQAAFSWLDLSQTDSEEERRRVLGHVSQLLEMLLSSIESVDEEDDDETGILPGDFDGWVFGHVARAIAQSRDDEQASSLWRPILSLGSQAHDWIERFFWYWFSDGFQVSGDQGRFLKRWSEMLEFALESPHWDPEQVREFDLDGSVVELMGYDFGLYSIAADTNFAGVLEGLIPLYEVAAQRWFRMPRVANGFARSLSEPGYDRLLRPGVRWLHRAIEDRNDDRAWDENGFESNLVSALHRCWEKHHESVRTDSGLQSAFLGLLTGLSSRGNHAAMALRERLLDSIQHAG